MVYIFFVVHMIVAVTIAAAAAADAEQTEWCITIILLL